MDLNNLSEFELEEILLENKDINGKEEYEVFYSSGEYELKKYYELIDRVKNIGANSIEYVDEQYDEYFEGGAILILLNNGEDFHFSLS